MTLMTATVILLSDCFKDPAAVPFVATPKPKGIDEAYRKLLD